MGAKANAPVIIKKKKVVGGDGHHGGAWKVAYADFVTAMMAFFMLMWLLNATTEKQRKGIADYFSPTIPINRVSGGGDGAFGGETVFSEMTLPQNGTGALSIRPSDQDEARGRSGLAEDGAEKGSGEEVFKKVEELLLGRSGESIASDKLLEHIVTRVTDEGLVIELFSLPDAPLFDEQSDVPMPVMKDLAAMLARVFTLVENDVAVEGHVRSRPVVLDSNPVWERSSLRADTVRGLLEDTGLQRKRMQRITGHADRAPVTEDPMAMRNDRIEVILLR